MDKGNVLNIHNGILALKILKILLFATFVNPENIMLSEISQKEKNKTSEVLK
jgi:hypothetical protein